MPTKPARSVTARGHRRRHRSVRGRTFAACEANRSDLEHAVVGVARRVDGADQPAVMEDRHREIAVPSFRHGHVDLHPVRESEEALRPHAVVDEVVERGEQRGPIHRRRGAVERGRIVRVGVPRPGPRAVRTRHGHGQHGAFGDEVGDGQRRTGQRRPRPEVGGGEHALGAERDLDAAANERRVVDLRRRAAPRARRAPADPRRASRRGVRRQPRRRRPRGARACGRRCGRRSSRRSATREPRGPRRRRSGAGHRPAADRGCGGAGRRCRPSTG